MRLRLSKPKEFIIDRSKWVQGGDDNFAKLGDSCLLNSEGNMCCLGFYSEACGVPRKLLADETEPNELKCRVPHMSLGEKSTRFATDLMRLNDNVKTYSLGHETYPGVRRKDKEKLLKEKFALIDVEVKFVGRYPKGVV